MKNKIIITIITILLLISVGYIVFEKFSEYLYGERLLYYNQGQLEGILSWNNQVVQIVTNEGELPFIVNNSVQTISIKQLYERRLK